MVQNHTCWRPKLALVEQTGLTGLDHVVGLATPTGQTGLPGIRVQLELFVDLDL